ncbi:hypothetical protein ACIRO1_47325 [Streptomyces sp. NPDC102381]|uniref:hypothetical protein n=1 Tax=Streptomyces sp. NPDC102381 TaxID=3366164 RepID=UPI003818D5F7
MTLPTVEVLRLLLDASADDLLWAARISERTGLRKNTVSQILVRLAALEWVVLRKEEGLHPGRPPRALCTLTEKGRRQAEAALAAQRASFVPEAGGTSAHVDKSRPARGNARALPEGSEQVPQQVGPRSQWQGHLPLNFSELKARIAAVEVSCEEGDAPESDSGGRLTVLKEALKALQTVKRNLTEDVLARSCVAPGHRLEYEEVMRGILTEITDLRSKAMQAHNC